MNKPTIFHVDGSQVPLGERIGRGGEGEVYALAGDASHAVKVYLGAGGADRREKIMAMVLAKLAERTPLAAFPIKPVKKRNGEFAGFVMRKVSGHKPLFELYSPGARKTNFPDASYPFLVQTASNFANAVGAVHAGGCVIGDINHSGILIADNAKVALIDADSFQVSHGSKQFLCRVGVPDYTPPELQGLKLNTVVRTPNHDNFGAAIVIFQLLFMGRHPFAGSYQNGDMPIERAIREHRFAYGRRQVGMKPPPAAPLLKHFPPSIGDAFEAAFAPAATRPDPRQWIALLDELRRGLRACSANNLHHYWQGAPECPWCRMERLQGISLFLPPYKPGADSPAPGQSSGTFNLEMIWRAIEGIPQPGPCPPTPKLHDISPEPSPEARRLRGEAWKHKIHGGIAALAAGGILLANAALWILWVPAGWYGLAQLFGKSADVGSLRSNKNTLDRQWTKALGDWQTRCGNEPFAKLKSELFADKNAYQGLASEQAQRIQKYQQNRRTAQLNAYLDTHYIRRAKISGIGPGKTATLASYGIETAADLTSRGRIEQVPGFGPTTAFNLLAWRRTIESRFVYNPNPNQADQVQLNTIRSEIARKEAQLRQKLVGGHAALSKASQQALALRQVPDPMLQRLHEQMQQLEADLRYVHGSFALPLGWIAAAILALAALIALGRSGTDNNISTASAPSAPKPILGTPVSENATAAVDEDAPDEVTQADLMGSSTYYAVRETNIRARASTATSIVGKLTRGGEVYGVGVEAGDSAKRWLKITTGPYRGYYVSAEWNLSSQARPEIDTSVAGPRVTTDSTSAYREPSLQSELIRQLLPGTPVSLVGLTSEGFAEISLKSGTIAYVDPGSLVERGLSSTEPTVESGPNEELPAGAATAPVPHQNLQSLIASGDYPLSAIYGRQQGDVRVRLDIDASGGVTGCSVERSSGANVLDLTTCRLLKTRARFAPAHDSGGNLVPASVSATISWVLP